MDHSLEKHLTSLNSLCRICGNISTNKKQKSKSIKPLLVDSLSIDILLVFGVNVKKDVDDKHSKCMCRSCGAMIRNVKKRQSETTLSLSSAKARIWCCFDTSLSIK